VEEVALGSAGWLYVPEQLVERPVLLLTWCLPSDC
jgi:hypothetical protein